MSDSTARRYFLLALLAGSGLLTYFIFFPFFAPLALAIVFATVLQPVYQRLLSLFRGRAGLSALSTIALTLAFILIPLGLLGTQIFFEAQRLYDSVTTNGGNDLLVALLKGFNSQLHQYVPAAPPISVDVNRYTAEFSNWIVSHIGPFFSSVAKWGISTFVFLITLFCLLTDGPKLKNAVLHLSPLSKRENDAIVNRLTMAINTAIRGNVSVAVAQGCLASLGFAVFGVPNPVLWGSVTAIAALIPSMGTSLVIGPAILYLFFTHHNWPAIGLLIWGAFAVGLIDNFLYPKLVGNGIQMHPLFVLLAVLGGLAFFGPIGFILGPLSISLFFALLDIYTVFIGKKSH